MIILCQNHVEHLYTMREKNAEFLVLNLTVCVLTSKL
jgi:hypothetical protein